MPEMNVRAMKALSLLWTICCASLAAAPGANSAEPIKIGAVLPFSGGVELYGRQAKLGLDLAAKDINAAGGILGRPVEVVYADDKTDPAVATDVTLGTASDSTSSQAQFASGTDNEVDVLDTNTSATLLTKTTLTLDAGGVYTMFMAGGGNSPVNGTLRKDR